MSKMGVKRFKVKNCWENAGKEGEIFGEDFLCGFTLWSVVRFDFEEDPTLMKTESIKKEIR